MIGSRALTILLTASTMAMLALPSAAVAQRGFGQQLANRPVWSNDQGRFYGREYNYDRAVNGSDASTPGHN